MNGSYLVFALTLLGCSRSASDSEIAGASVAGRQAPAAGYLVARITGGAHAGALVRGTCGATLIAPKTVVTSAGCVAEELAPDRVIVGVGFGDSSASGTVYDTVGVAKDWIHPRYLVQVGGHYRPDARFDVAIVPLAREVSGIAPMSVHQGRVAPGTPALLVGYGRTLVDDPAAAPDDVSTIVEHPEAYPGTRKRIALEVLIERNTIDAKPKSSAFACWGDFGGPLVVDDGTIAGVFGRFDQEADLANLFDAMPLCRPTSGGTYANLQFEPMAMFLSERLRRIE